MNKFLITITTVLALTACAPNTINGQKMDNTPNIQKPQEVHNTQTTPKQTPSTTLTAKTVKHPQGKDATPSEIAECQKQGGQIMRQGLAQYDFCVVEFADKGKVCSDGNECQAGRCIADGSSFNDEVGATVKGVCPSNNVPFGCYETVNKGKFGGFLCVD